MAKLRTQKSFSFEKITLSSFCLDWVQRRIGSKSSKKLTLLWLPLWELMNFKKLVMKSNIKKYLLNHVLNLCKQAGAVCL